MDRRLLALFVFNSQALYVCEKKIIQIPDGERWQLRELAQLAHQGMCK